MFILSVLWNLLVHQKFMIYPSSFYGQDYMFIIITGISYLVLTLLMVGFYSISTRNHPPIFEGVLLGVIAGVACVLAMDLMNIPFFKFGSIQEYAIQISRHVVEQGIGGFAIATIYSRSKKKMMRTPLLYEFYVR